MLTAQPCGEDQIGHPAMDTPHYDLPGAIVWACFMLTPFFWPRLQRACHSMAERRPNFFAVFLGFYAGCITVLFTGLNGEQTFAPGITGGIATAVGYRFTGWLRHRRNSENR